LPQDSTKLTVNKAEFPPSDSYLSRRLFPLPLFLPLTLGSQALGFAAPFNSEQSERVTTGMFSTQSHLL
jgi:hypothetical protein